MDFLFSQYEFYATQHIFLEITAVFFGLLSVWFAKKNKILVFPTGLISTSIFVYLLFEWQLLGDLLINVYYFIMSLYGWYYWGRQKNNQPIHEISYMSTKQWIISGLLLLGSLVFVALVYLFFGKFNQLSDYVDTFTTGVFFVAMWQMANRKIENWLFWIIGDVISVPLYFYKGYTFTSIQYLIFTVIAIYGYLAWKKIYNNSQVIALK
jgi:nicotinamide mononucleotide transporter